jgi:HEAT repeat protein
MMGNAGAFAAKLMPLISREDYKAASALLIEQSDEFASAVLDALAPKLAGDYYKDNARECAYFIEELATQLVRGPPPLRANLYLDASQALLQTQVHNNAVHWTMRLILEVDPEIAITLLRRLHNSARLIELIPLVGKLKYKCVVEHLYSIVDDPRPQVRCKVVRALAILADPGTFDVLVRRLSDPDEETRFQIVEALFSLDPDRAVQEAQSLANDLTQRIQLRTIQLMGQTGNLGCLPALKLKVTYPADSSVRLYAVKSVGEIRPADPPAEVVDALRDSNPSVRGMAAWALGQIGNPTVIPDLTLLSRDADEFAAWSAQEAIRRIKNEPTLC